MRNTTALIGLIELFEEAYAQKKPYSWLRDKINAMDGQVLPYLRLQRDRFAYMELKNALWDRLDRFQTTLAYEYDGKLFCVGKAFKCTEYDVENLYQYKLTSAQMDKLPRQTVWVCNPPVFYSR